MKRFLALSAVLAALCLTGCKEDKRTTWEHGEASKEIFASQVANPDAGQSNEPVAGLDGKVVSRAVKTYQEGEDKNKAGGGPSPSINLNLNSGSGGSQSSGK
jgi:hypothetical protein